MDKKKNPPFLRCFPGCSGVGCFLPHSANYASGCSHRVFQSETGRPEGLFLSVGHLFDHSRRDSDL